MMNIFTRLSIVSTLCLMILTVSCSSNGSGLGGSSVDTVTVATISDTTSFKKSNGDICAIYSDASFSYPTSYIDDHSLEKLQHLYTTLVLDAPDSLSLNDAMHRCVSNSLHQYDLSKSEDDQLSDYSIDESEPFLTYRSSSTVQLHYNKNGLVTFCRIDVVKKDTTVTSVTHMYYTFDLKTMSRVTVSNIVRDETIPQVTALLRARLLEQNKVANNDQLNELGYYNIDNLIVTQNFYFDEKGITWSYLPNKLAVSAVGEPHVTLTYDEQIFQGTKRDAVTAISNNA